MSKITRRPPVTIVELPTDEQLGTELAALVNGEGKNLNDVRMVAGTGELAKPIEGLAAAVFRVSGVDPKLRQFIVLRIAKLLNCQNLLGPNEQMATNLGAAPFELEGLRADGPVTHGDSDANLIMKATDELTTLGTLHDRTLEALLNRYDDQICRKYIMVISYYNMFARFFLGTRIPGESQEEINRKIGTVTSPV